VISFVQGGEAAQGKGEHQGRRKEEKKKGTHDASATHWGGGGGASPPSRTPAEGDPAADSPSKGWGWRALLALQKPRHPPKPFFREPEQGLLSAVFS